MPKAVEIENTGIPDAHQTGTRRSPVLDSVLSGSYSRWNENADKSASQFQTDDHRWDPTPAHGKISLLETRLWLAASKERRYQLAIWFLPKHQELHRDDWHSHGDRLKKRTCMNFPLPWNSKSKFKYFNFTVENQYVKNFHDSSFH